MASEDSYKVVPDPPCCKVACCRERVNDSCLCEGIGRLGFAVMDENRGWIMKALALLAIVASVLSIIPLVSLSSDKDVVKDTYWTYGKVDDDNSELYLSIRTVVIERGANDNHSAVNMKFNWNSDACYEFGDNTDYCQDCEDACDVVMRTCIANFITILPTIMTNYKRSHRGSDLNFTKFTAIFTGTLSSIIMLSALSTFSDQCYDSLPNHTREGLPIDYSYGPGFVCLLFPQVFKLIEVVFNLVTPVPQKLRPVLESLNEPLSPNGDDMYSDF